MNRLLLTSMTLCLGFAMAAATATQTANNAAGHTSASQAAIAVRNGVQAYRQQHEKAILTEFTGLLALPNVATTVADVERNAAVISTALQKRGFHTRLLSAGPGTPPAVYGELLTPGATKTIVFYAHYDGQPVAQPGWRTPPFTPTMRTGGTGPDVHDVDWRAAPSIDPEWRIYARSAGDDKASVQVMLSAIDALHAMGKQPTVNVKVLYEGEEEQGSQHLPAILAANAKLLAGDLLIVGDGPRDQSGAMQIVFGARGVSGLDLTVYGPRLPLHDGHYGNWAPNPAVMLTHLLDALRDENGHILIPGFYDDVRPMTPAEATALAALPDVETALKQNLALGRTETNERLGNALFRPALNVRGIRVGNVGKDAANVISTEARASLDFRLVPNETPAGVRDRTNAYLRTLGWYVVDHDPTNAERSAHPKVVQANWDLNYAAYRANIDSHMANVLVDSIQQVLGTPVIRMPMSGGSTPMSMFATALHMPIISVPIANYDDNQHAANENLRVQNLWDGITIYAGILTGQGW